MPKAKHKQGRKGCLAYAYAKGKAKQGYLKSMPALLGI
jgi:hypothetical protein